MKKLFLFAGIAALLTLGAGQAFAHNSPSQATKSVTVVMKDPGCHWFSVKGKLVAKLSVKGPVKLANYDEDTILIAGPKGVVKDKVGKSVTLSKGTYRITMVGQKSDDNHLKLIVG